MYDRSLIDYLPGVLGGVREYQALTAAEDPEFALLYDNARSALDDQFIMSSTENGVRRRESIWKIVPMATLTLDERKFAIMAREAEQLPYTYRMLLRMLGALCGPDGYKAELEPGSYRISVKIALTVANNFINAGAMLRRVCPANITVNTILMYNSHSLLSRFTHGELRAWTQHQLRNEVL